MALTRTPGGLVLPGGMGLADVIPGLAGREPAVRAGRGRVPTAPRTGREPAYGPTVTYQRIYDSQPVLASVVNKLAKHAARVPWVIDVPNTKTGRREVVPNHPALRLLEHPAPGLGGMAFKMQLYLGLLIEGNTVILQQRDAAALPIELFPLTWEYLTPYRPRGGYIDQWLTNELGVTQRLDVDEILHVAYWSAAGAAGQIGISPIEQLGTTVTLEDAARRHAFAALSGTINASHYLELPEEVDLTDKLAVDLRAGLDAMSGVDGGTGVPVVAQGAKLVSLARNATEAALTETRERDLEEVCFIYDVSPTAIGFLKHATQRSNVDALTRDFYVNTLGPPLALAAEAIQVQVIERVQGWREQGARVRPDLTEFVRGDPVAWDEVISRQLRDGRLTLNETRDDAGRPRYPDEKADEPWVADNNLHPLSQVGEDDGEGEDEDELPAVA